MKSVKIVYYPTVTDRPSICNNKSCKKEFIIPKEKVLENYNRCPHCGSKYYRDKED